MGTTITKIILFATALLGVLMTCGLVSLLGLSLLRPLPYANYPTRTAAPPVPIYPDAQNVAHVQTPNARTYRVTTFDTTATPEAIYQYHDEQLPRQEAQGWRPYEMWGFSLAVSMRQSAVRKASSCRLTPYKIRALPMSP